MLQRYQSELRGHQPFENAPAVHRKARHKKEALEKDLSAVQARMAELRSDLDQARAARRAAENAARNASRAVQQLEEKIEGLRTRQAAEAKRMEEMDPLEDPELYKQVAAEKDKIDAQIAELQEQLQEKEADVEEQKEKRVAAQQKLADVQSQMAVVERDMERMEARVEETARTAHLADTQRDRLALLIRVHRRMAWALSILGFTLMGIPLGIMAGSRSIMMAFGISFLLVLVLFYVPLSAGIQMSNEGVVHPTIGIFAGNALICLIGLALTVHVCRQ
jgi:lipopolysaccharide export LptBFGC system permease protein LptF